MKNRELFSEDPTKSELLNNGVAEVSDIQTEAEVLTLRYELKTFVCEGQYAKGLARILSSYLQNLDKPEQPAVWVGGFYGSGKSHLVKMLRYLWLDYEFPDKATARGIARLPNEINDSLRELSTVGKRFGRLHAASGKLNASAGNSVRLALLAIVFRSVGLSEKYPVARFEMWLKRQGIYEQIKNFIEDAGKSFDKELLEMYVSPHIAKALLSADPSFASSPAEAKSLIKAQYPNVDDISLTDMVNAINNALSEDDRFPASLIVFDEVQQYIGDSSDRALDVQDVTEACIKKFGGRLLFVGTGQSALSSTPQLQKLQGRFRISIHLSDADVETVIRKVVLAKKPDKVSLIKETLSKCSGEISRHLIGTKIEQHTEDDEFNVADYPILPTRNRFWERVLRAVDQAGTSGQLRTQLKIVHEGVKQIADKPLGTVVGGDFIYDQIATDLLQTSVLNSEIHELIQKQHDATPEGGLRARLCALIFLIGKLPTESGADTGLRATPDTLADLLIEDLKAGSADLRKQIPDLLKGLVESGSLMQVDDEYRLQTRESSAWDTDYRNRLAKILNDDQRLASERADKLRNECSEQIKNLKLPHGKSNESRKLELHFTKQAPDPKGQTIPVWVRDGWDEDDNSFLADVRRAGTDSPMIYLFIPRRSNEALRSAIANLRAAEETLAGRGVPATDTGLEARQAMETRKMGAAQTLSTTLDEIFDGARVFLAGGTEYPGLLLNTRVLDAARDALARLYPQFDIADDNRWHRVIEQAKKGDGSALTLLGYAGDPENHPVCSAILKEMGAGKKGSELRRIFSGSPYGWPRDAIDGALLTLFVTGKLRASQDGRPIELKQLDQTKIGVAEFRTEQVTISTAQRLTIRKLFQQAGLDCKPNEEPAIALEFIKQMLALAQSAGGEPPLPTKPNTSHIEQISSLAGNEQLIALFDNREGLAKEAQNWQRAKGLIQSRLPRWNDLNRLLAHSKVLPVYNEINSQALAISQNRSLLDGADHVPSLCDRLTQDLRTALIATRDGYKNEYESQMDLLTASPAWQKLTTEQREQILSDNMVALIPDVRVATEIDVLNSLDAISFDGWRVRHDALRQRFEEALLAAARMVEPKAVRVTLPKATLHNEQEVDRWLADTREKIVEKLTDGPVIV
jgi:hypothetical protein